MYQWNNFWYRRTMWLILLPISLQIVVFTVWSCIFMPNDDLIPESTAAILELISFCLAAYFIIIESVCLYGIINNKSDFSLQGSLMETVLGFLSPVLILVCQGFAYFNTSNLHEPDQFWFWELVAWTAFCLWIRFVLMLRSVEYLSAPIKMVLISFE